MNTKEEIQQALEALNDKMEAIDYEMTELEFKIEKVEEMINTKAGLEKKLENLGKEWDRLDKEIDKLEKLNPVPEETKAPTLTPAGQALAIDRTRAGLPWDCIEGCDLIIDIGENAIKVSVVFDGQVMAEFPKVPADDEVQLVIPNVPLNLKFKSI